jgi:hypothetical protein
MAFTYSALICLSWVCHSDWQEQITDVAIDAGEPDVVEPNTVEPNAMEPDDLLEV